jgi:hypothetical protein
MNPHAEILPSPVRDPEPVPPAEPQREIDDDFPRELGDDPWDVFVPEDDYEPLPEYGDFWTEQDAARHSRQPHRPSQPLAA